MLVVGAALALLLGVAACGSGGTAGGSATDAVSTADTADLDATTADSAGGADATTADGLVAAEVADTADVPPIADVPPVEDVPASDLVGGDVPDSGPAACPTPLETLAYATIGPEGGVVTYGNISVVIPPGALASPSFVSLGQSQRTTPAGARSLTTLYEFGPAGLVLALPAKLLVTLPQLPANPSDVVLMAGPMTGPFAEQPATLTGQTWEASLTGPTYGYAARKSPAPTPTPDSCTKTGILHTLFDNFTGGSSYYYLYPRAEGDQFRVTGGYQKEAQWTGQAHAYNTAGAEVGTAVNLLPGTSGTVFGPTTLAEPNGNWLLAYDGNKVGGSEVWVGRISSTGTVVTPLVNISNDKMYSQSPKIGRYNDGSVLVVWMVFDDLSGKRWLKGAVLDSDLKAKTTFDITPAEFGTAPSTFDVVAAGGAAGVVWSYASGVGNGIRYKAWNAAGCPLTAQVEVAGFMVQAPVLTAASAGPIAAVAYANSNDNFRVRLLDISTGSLGPVRTYGPILSHPGITPAPGGWRVAGVVAGSPKSSVSVLKLDAELDILASLTSVGEVGGYSVPARVAMNPAGTAGAVTWTSTGSEGLGTGPAKIQGYVQIMTCTP